MCKKIKNRKQKIIVSQREMIYNEKTKLIVRQVKKYEEKKNKKIKFVMNDEKK